MLPLGTEPVPDCWASANRGARSKASGRICPSVQSLVVARRLRPLLLAQCAIDRDARRQTWNGDCRTGGTFVCLARGRRALRGPHLKQKKGRYKHVANLVMGRKSSPSSGVRML